MVVFMLQDFIVLQIQSQLNIGQIQMLQDAPYLFLNIIHFICFFCFFILL